MIDPVVAIALLFFVSGAASLLLETAAVRAFLELFGSTAASLGAVGASFLVCLAVGAFVVGSRADRARRPLRAYALVEGVACVGGLLGAWILAHLDGVATALARSEAAGSGAAASLATRLLVCVAVLIVPVGALGATLPLLARVGARSSSRDLRGSRGAVAGRLQASNTLGATVGALVGGALLLGAIGTRSTWLLGAAMNGLVAVGAFLLARSAESEDVVEAAPPPSNWRVEGEGDAARTLPLVLAAFLTGFTVLAHEVLLFRGLGQVARGSQDTLAVLLAAFLLCGALGSAFGARLARSRAGSGFVLGQMLAVATPLVALVWLRATSRAGDGSWLRFGESALTWHGRLGSELFGALLVAGPPAFATAIAFPCACELAPEPRFGRLVAWLSGAWTAGAALGGVVVPAVLPYVGLSRLLAATSVLPLAALVVVALAGGARLVARRTGLVVGGVVVALLLAFVPIAGGNALERLAFVSRVAGGPNVPPVAYAEGAIADVAVVDRPDGTRVIAVDDQFALGGSGASRVETMEGVLPALLHEGGTAPKRALVLGVGAGRTVAALRDVGVEEVDAVELLPPVLSFLPFFRAENGGVEFDPHVHFHALDARAFVRAAQPESYDLVVGDLFFPWQAQAGLLFTQEHFERVRRLLKPGGLFCQWLPGHQLRWEEIGIAGRTFAKVFGGATLWLAESEFPYPVLGLVATRERLELDVPKIEERLAKHPAKPLLDRLGVGAAKDLLALYVADEWFFREKFEQHDTVDTADRSLVEFAAARRFESDPVQAILNRRRLFELHEDVVYRMTQSAIDKKQLALLKRDLSAAARLTWQLFDTRTLLLVAAANRERPANERTNDPAELEMKAFNDAWGAHDERPDDPRAADLLHSILVQKLVLHDYGFVVQGVGVLENDAKFGAKANLRDLRGQAYLVGLCDSKAVTPDKTGRALELAIADFRKALDLDPTLVEAKVHLAVALFLDGTKSSWEEAKSQLTTARGLIHAERRPDGHGLPAYAEAIWCFLGGGEEEARAWLESAAPSPLVAKIVDRMKAGPPPQ